MDLGIEGKVALVTAASKGLGRASAMALAADGVKVVICARGADALEQTAADIRATGGEVTAIQRDVTEHSAPADLVAATVDTYGSIDILVPNAGGPPPGLALDITDEQIDAAINAQLTTSVRLVREAVPHMRRNGWGRICAIESFTVKQPVSSLALSNMARTGFWAWAKTAASDLAAEGITVNLACPGHHATDRMKQLGADPTKQRMGDPADFGRVVAFLCSAHAGFVTGVALQVDGGAVAGLL